MNALNDDKVRRDFILPRRKRDGDYRKTIELCKLAEKFINETGDYSYYVFAASILNEHEELAESLIDSRSTYGCKRFISDLFKMRMKNDHHRCKTKKIDAVKIYNAAVRAYNERNGTNYLEIKRWKQEDELLAAQKEIATIKEEIDALEKNDELRDENCVELHKKIVELKERIIDLNH